MYTSKLLAQERSWCTGNIAYNWEIEKGKYSDADTPVYHAYIHFLEVGNSLCFNMNEAVAVRDTLNKFINECHAHHVSETE